MEQRRGPGRPPKDPTINKARPPRVPMSAGNKLRAPAREGYQRYWTITGPDHPGVLEEMQAAWWEFVLDDDGEQITRPAGRGNTHVLMQIQQEYYDEDIAAQQRRNIDSTQKAVQAVGRDEYVPMGRNQVVEREVI